MSGLRDHGIVAVSGTLAVMTRMNMHVRHDGQFGVPAFLPDHAELAAVELDDAVSKAVGVYIIVEEELFNSPSPPLGTAEKKGTAFAPPGGTAL